MTDRISDGHGEARVEDPNRVLAAYHRWLHDLAYRMLPVTSSLHDDLVQEGRIAMWNALGAYDSSQGGLATWLTQAAKMRMADFLRRRKPTGHISARGVREVETEAILDGHEEGVAERLFGMIDRLDEVEIAYHHGEIQQALDSLPPKQREYVFLRFWAGLDPTSKQPEIRALIRQFPAMQSRELWSGGTRRVGAKQRLAESLGHLVGVGL